MKSAYIAFAFTCLAAGAAMADTKAPVHYDPVHAPTAQTLVQQIAMRHDDMVLLGVHATVPGSKNNVIIACNDQARIGKPSSKGDLALIGKPKIMVARLPQKNVYEVAMTLNDAQGRTVGMMVDQMRLNAVPDEVEALRRALEVRSELEKNIPSEGALFE
ncbi:hypothetical protein [Gluconacetobacter tumulicola]|uniref:Uncharacterized protein n=2 Tax=Gluconacetobacter TaxID=89583 RepID=A0A7W4JC47_9PROT|nr:hypothetical protein [Gluconacetobacter tumulicola]MBB2178473.1 hypothetical protein [Gluconacetobacter tumulicola]